MADNNFWLYTVYRNRDDRLMCLDVNAETAASVMGVKVKSFRRMLFRNGGVGEKWTIIRTRKKEVEAQTNDVE